MFKSVLRYVLPLCVFTLMPLMASAQKFALIDMEYILKNVPAYERANEQLNQVSKKWQAEVEALNTEASTMYKNYQNEVVFLSQDQKKKRQDAIMAKEKQASDLKRKYFGPEGELFKKRTSLITPIQDEIYNAERISLTNVAIVWSSTVQAMPLVLSMALQRWISVMRYCRN